jgi:NADH:ubiquinone oxidoreductase subunit E
LSTELQDAAEILQIKLIEVYEWSASYTMQIIDNQLEKYMFEFCQNVTIRLNGVEN